LTQIFLEPNKSVGKKDQREEERLMHIGGE